jgi:hypothetical protein
MATKPAIVTKKQLEESGFDNLRDYLNAKRGLTRRDEQKFIGDKPKMGAYVPRDSDTRKGEIMTSKNAKGRDNYVRSGQKSMDTEREPEAAASTNKPGTNISYENTETSDMSMRHGGAVKKMASGGSASSRADGIATKGKTRGRMC